MYSENLVKDNGGALPPFLNRFQWAKWIRDIGRLKKYRWTNHFLKFHSRAFFKCQILPLFVSS